MSFWDYLATPGGQELTHVVVLLVAALAALLSAWAGRIAHKNSKLLNGHLTQHLRDMELRRHPLGPVEPPPS